MLAKGLSRCSMGLRIKIVTLTCGCMRTAYINRRAGRKFTMAAAGVMFEIGGILLAAAMNYEMLVIGRCFLGVAVSSTTAQLSC